MVKYAWSGSSIRALRRQLRLSQAQFGQELGVRQATISEWEAGLYQPRGASAKLLSLIAERAEFQYRDQGSGARGEDREQER